MVRAEESLQRALVSPPIPRPAVPRTIVRATSAPGRLGFELAGEARYHRAPYSPRRRAVSAWDLSKYEYAPLQDNVYIALKCACDRWLWFRPLLLAWRVDMHWLLFALVGLCLAPGWEAVQRSGFGMATRAMRTICIAHAIRTAAFLVTVLPNPQRNCYARSFPPPPTGAHAVRGRR